MVSLRLTINLAEITYWFGFRSNSSTHADVLLGWVTGVGNKALLNYPKWGRQSSRAEYTCMYFMEGAVRADGYLGLFGTE